MRAGRFRGLFFCGSRIPAFCGRADVFNIGKVACPSGSEFGRYQVVGGNEIRFQAAGRVNHGFHAPVPCRVKIDAGNGRKNIDA
jgi:hypothetical protein